MSRLPFVLLSAVVALVAFEPVVGGQPQHSIGRYLGTGWSDGYHSRAGCPPKRHLLHQYNPHYDYPHHDYLHPWARNGEPAAPGGVPWWQIPSVDAEELPRPAGTSGHFAPRGPSLFRQPGEGSTVTVTSGPNPAAAR